MALRAITKAPLASLAPLSGRSVNQLIDDLTKAGVKAPNADASLDSLAPNNRALQAKAIAVLFGKR